MLSCKFTKEELLIFKDAIKIYLRTPSPIEAEHLQEKLQGMIDNYCEHESDGIIYPNPYYEPYKDNLVIYKCGKCGVNYENQ